MGYPSQTHTITTEDCYILEMHRIPHGKGMTKATKPPILLVHGLLGSSADWVMGIPEKYLGKFSVTTKSCSPDLSYKFFIDVCGTKFTESTIFEMQKANYNLEFFFVKKLFHL